MFPELVTDPTELEILPWKHTKLLKRLNVNCCNTAQLRQHHRDGLQALRALLCLGEFTTALQILIFSSWLLSSLSSSALAPQITKYRCKELWQRAQVICQRTDKNFSIITEFHREKSAKANIQMDKDGAETGRLYNYSDCNTPRVSPEPNSTNKDWGRTWELEYLLLSNPATYTCLFNLEYYTVFKFILSLKK